MGQRVDICPYIKQRCGGDGGSSISKDVFTLLAGRRVRIKARGFWSAVRAVVR